jgi:TonB family protein
MNNNPMRQALFVSLGLVSMMAWTQQSAPSNAADSPPQIAASHDALTVPLKTADGMTVCSANYKLESLPDDVNHGVLPPRVIKTSEATFSDEGRQYARQFKKDHHVEFEAISIVGLIVDTKGMPQAICVHKEVGHGLDRKAVEAVAKFRFKPATRDGNPVPVHMTVQITFKLP